LSELGFNDGKDLSETLLSIEKETVEYKKTIIVFMSSDDPNINQNYVNNHLLCVKGTLFCPDLRC
jgi:hypothetical protein